MIRDILGDHSPGPNEGVAAQVMTTNQCGVGADGAPVLTSVDPLGVDLSRQLAEAGAEIVFSRLIRSDKRSRWGGNAYPYQGRGSPLRPAFVEEIPEALTRGSYTK